VAEFLYIESGGIWFSCPRSWVTHIRMNQKPGWLPEMQGIYAGVILHDDETYQVILPRLLFADEQPVPATCHLLFLRLDEQIVAIAANHIRTHLDLPGAVPQSYSEWRQSGATELFAHHFPIQAEMLNQAAVSGKEKASNAN
jgi:hypothetical protein